MEQIFIVLVPKLGKGTLEGDSFQEKIKELAEATLPDYEIHVEFSESPDTAKFHTCYTATKLFLVHTHFGLQERFTASMCALEQCAPVVVFGTMSDRVEEVRERYGVDELYLPCDVAELERILQTYLDPVYDYERSYLLVKQHKLHDQINAYLKELKMDFHYADIRELILNVMPHSWWTWQRIMTGQKEKVTWKMTPRHGGEPQFYHTSYQVAKKFLAMHEFASNYELENRHKYVEWYDKAVAGKSSIERIFSLFFLYCSET